MLRISGFDIGALQTAEAVVVEFVVEREIAANSVLIRAQSLSSFSMSWDFGK
ncbi:hypothetical protein RND59_00540 [Vibrio ruber]|uniref:hypothetical protein n=1 Tax=Vibrio ruber TaxID=184755 RepID=UPI002892C0BE|nr:hypothetical protein [Vibrio ruber]WNJ95644.1 hypothetical protein RND59_00540 [Vibrio ruber]